MQVDVLEYTGQATAVLDAQGHVVKASPSLTKLVGPIEGSPIAKHVAASDLLRFQDVLAIARGGQASHASLRFDSRMGTVLAQLRLIPVDGGIVLAITRPVSAT